MGKGKYFTSGYKIYRKTILIVGALFGFSTAIVAQYGAPMAHYKITGTIKSKDCVVPIPEIKVKYSENKQSSYEYNQTLITDTSGKFEFYFYEEYGVSVDNKKILIIAEDADGKENKGDFLFLEQWVTLKQKSGGNKYQKDFEDIELYMEYNGKSPCIKELNPDSIKKKKHPIKKPLTPTDSILHEPLANDTLAEELPNTGDSLKDSGRGEPPLLPADDIIIVYPNPSNGLFIIKFSAHKNSAVTIAVYDSNSKLILKEFYGNCEGLVEKQIDLESQAPGTYYLYLSLGKKSYTKTLIKQ